MKLQHSDELLYYHTLYQWLDNNTQGLWCFDQYILSEYQNDQLIIGFEKKSDLMLYKLTYGGV